MLYQEPLDSSEKLDDVLLLVILITYLKFKFVSTSSAGSEEEDFEGFEEDEFDYLSSWYLYPNFVKKETVKIKIRKPSVVLQRSMRYSSTAWFLYLSMLSTVICSLSMLKNGRFTIRSIRGQCIWCGPRRIAKNVGGKVIDNFGLGFLISIL